MGLEHRCVSYMCFQNSNIKMNTQVNALILFMHNKIQHLAGRRFGYRYHLASHQGCFLALCLLGHPHLANCQFAWQVHQSPEVIQFCSRCHLYLTSCLFFAFVEQHEQPISSTGTSSTKRTASSICTAAERSTSGRSTSWRPTWPIHGPAVCRFVNRFSSTSSNSQTFGSTIPKSNKCSSNDANTQPRPI